MKGEVNTDIESLISDFITEKSVAGLSPATISFYRQNLERFCWWLGNNGKTPDVQDISVRDLRSFLGYIQNTPKRWYKGSNSSRDLPSISTVDAYWRTLQSLFSWLVREGIINADSNPMKNLVRPKVPKKIIPDIPLPLIKRALDSWDVNSLAGARNRAIVLMLLDTGIRLSECASLTLSDLNLDSGLLKVFGKGKQRRVRIGDMSQCALEHYLSLRKSFVSEALWIKPDGQLFKRIGIQTMVRRLRKFGGNVRWSPHTFRNTFSLNYLRAGGDPFTLQILGGWEDLDMPRRYCAALREEDAFAVHKRASPADQMKSLYNLESQESS